MTDISHAARSETEVGPAASAEDGDASGGPWVDALEAVYETDPALIGPLVPPPLQAGPDALVRLTLVVGADAVGEPLDHAWFGVQVSYEGTIGEYALFVGVGTDQELIAGRELLGEPRKLVSVTSHMNSSRVQHKAERRGRVVARIVGSVDALAEPESAVRTEFGFRCLPPSEPGGPFADPELMELRRTIIERRAVGLTGVVRLGTSPHDPMFNLRTRRTRSIRLSQRTTSIVGRSIGTVSADDFEPFIKHRYDQTSIPTTHLSSS